MPPGIPGIPSNPNQPGAGGRSQVELIWEAIRQIEQNQQQIVEHINKWVAKIQGIDSVAFASLALHDGKEFKLDEEKVNAIHTAIQDVLKEMGRYRTEQMEKEKVAAESVNKNPSAIPDAPQEVPKPEEPVKSPEPEAKPEGKRLPKKGKTNDGPTDTAKR